MFSWLEPLLSRRKQKSAFCQDKFIFSLPPHRGKRAFNPYKRTNVRYRLTMLERKVDAYPDTNEEKSSEA